MYMVGDHLVLNFAVEDERVVRPLAEEVLRLGPIIIPAPGKSAP